MNTNPNTLKFITAVLLLIGLSSPCIHAQTETEEPEILPRNIEALIISDKRPPDFYYQNLEEEFTPFRIGFQRAGGINPVPATRTLKLFKQLTSESEELPATYEPVVELDLPPGTDPLLLVFYLNKERKTQYRFLDAGPEAFGAMEVQLINLSDSLKVIALLDEKRFDLEPKKEVRTAVNVTQNKRFSFRYGSVQPSGNLYESPETRLRIPFENMRLRIFFAPVQRIVQTENGPQAEMVLRDARVFERVQP